MRRCDWCSSTKVHVTCAAINGHACAPCWLDRQLWTTASKYGLSWRLVRAEVTAARVAAGVID